MANKISIYRGTTYDFTYNHTDVNGDPVSLVGSTVYFTVKTNEYDDDLTDADALIKKTVTDHNDAAAGETSWTLNDEDTQIEPGTFYFDVVVEDSEGLSDPPSLIGTFKVTGKPTNRNVGNE